MKNRVNISIVIFILLYLTQLSIADIDIKEPTNKVQNNNSKKLKVEPNATKIGEKSSSKIKTRAIRMEHPEDNPQNSANVNIGKIEFYVK